MANGAGQEELVGFGGEREREPVTRRLRGHPWLVVLLVGAVVGGGVVAVAVNRSSAPALPTLSVRSTIEAPDPVAPNEPFPWSPASDGRPRGPATLNGEVALTFAGVGPDQRVELYGVAGPGITTPRLPVRRLEAGATTARLIIETPVDCEDVDLPVAPDAYGIAVRITGGSRATRGTLDAGATGRTWAESIQAACASWLARTHVTITTATVTPDAARPRARVAMTLTNDGDRDVYVTEQRSEGSKVDVTLQPAGALRVPANGTLVVTADVVVTTCDSVASIRTTGDGTDAPVAVTSDVIDVYGNAGLANGRSLGPSWTNGFGPTPLLFSQKAAGTLSDGLRVSCGDIEGFAALVEPGGTTYDATSRVLSVRLLVDGPPRKIHDIRLITTTGDFARDTFVPLTARTGRLAPDFTGQVATTLRYRVPTNFDCPSGELFLPGFDLVVRVPVKVGFKTVRFSAFALQWDDAAVRAAICADR